MGLDVEALAALVAAIETPAGASRVVAVDGPAGAGKTELAGRLSALLERATVLHMDSVYPGWDGLEEGAGYVAGEVIPALAQGTAVHLRTWDWEADRPGPPLAVPAEQTVIIEGVGSGSKAGSPHVGLLIWLDADTEVRRRRAVDRDGAAFADNWDRWALQERRHFEREQTEARADVRIRTDVANDRQ